MYKYGIYVCLVFVALVACLGSAAAADDAQGMDLQVNGTLESGHNSTFVESDSAITANQDGLDDGSSSNLMFQSTNYTCGPAALATALKNLGINTTEEELMKLAGTDENGTTMYGLVEAARAKGVNAVAMKLSTDELKTNTIIHLIMDGEAHYSFLKEINEDNVLLADPSLGNIELDKEEFNRIYTGYALIINPITPQVTAQDNQTTNTTQTTDNNTASETLNNQNTTPQDTENQLTTEEMQKIQGKGLWRHKHWHPWKWRCSYHWKGWRRVYNRLYYSRHIFLGAVLVMGGIASAESGNIYGAIGGVGSGLEIMDSGFKEYMAHYKYVC